MIVSVNAGTIAGNITCCLCGFTAPYRFLPFCKLTALSPISQGSYYVWSTRPERLIVWSLLGLPKIITCSPTGSVA